MDILIFMVTPFINYLGKKYHKFIYWCNEFDAITDDGKVIIERMEEVYNKLGLEY